MEEKRGDSSDARFFAYAKAFIVPTLLLKAAIIFFGLNYSMYPGEGYGWGLFASVALSLLNFAIFIWKNYNEPEDQENTH